ncbi:MAG: MFS transporter [Tepidiformaceae bacterium]
MSTSTSAPDTTPAKAKPRFFYGWWIVSAGAVIQLLNSALLGQAYGTYVVLLRDEFGWSKTALAGAASLREAESGITGPFQGFLLDRFGPRAVARVGIIIFAAGFMIFSQVNSLFTFYLAFLVMATGASLAGYLTITFTIVQWFERRRGTAISLASAGFAMGGMVAPAVVFVLENAGWRWTAFLSGVLILVVGLPMTQLLHHRPSSIGLLPDGDPPDTAERSKARAAADAEDFTLREALRAPAFWWISLGHASALFVVSAMGVHLVSHLNEGHGYSLGQASGIVFLMTTLFLIGTVSGGPIGDRVNKRALVVVCMGMHAVGLVLLSHAVNLQMIIAFTVLHGLAWGWRGPLMAALRADYFGRTNFGKILGVSNLIIIIGTILGPVIAGVLYDQTGNYRVGFDILAAIAGAGSIFFILATRPSPPDRTGRRPAISPEDLPQPA